MGGVADWVEWYSDYEYEFDEETGDYRLRDYRLGDDRPDAARTRQATEFERYMLGLVNAERREAGLDALSLEMRLNVAAGDYSRVLLREDWFDHVGPDGSEPLGRMEEAGFDFAGEALGAENLAYLGATGYAGDWADVRLAHEMLMDSPGHRANILDPGLDYVGMGIRVGPWSGWDDIMMVTQAFASTEGEVRLDPGGAVLVEFEGDAALAGGDRDDVLRSGDGADRLEGGGGDDLLNSGAGDDALFGGRGADLLYGKAGDDTLMGGSGGDQLSGGAGDDWLYAEEGNDSVAGGDGDDRMTGHLGDDTLDGGAGDDTLDGGSGDDVLSGGDGRNDLDGRAGDDRLSGGRDDDTLNGGAGDDWLAGGPGDDILYGKSGHDLLNGGAGDDTLSGLSGDDSLYGKAGDDSIRGGDGADMLSGLGGSDRLHGGGGDDLLRGGAGADMFVFGGGEGRDRVLDFEDGLDAIVVAGPADLSEMVVKDIGAHVLIRFDGTTVIVEDTHYVAMDLSDFIFV
jgi:uncharacterized protein YkwD